MPSSCRFLLGARCSIFEGGAEAGRFLEGAVGGRLGGELGCFAGFGVGGLVAGLAGVGFVAGFVLAADFVVDLVRACFCAEGFVINLVGVFAGAGGALGVGLVINFPTDLGGLADNDGLAPFSTFDKVGFLGWGKLGRQGYLLWEFSEALKQLVEENWNLPSLIFDSRCNSKGLEYPFSSRCPCTCCVAKSHTSHTESLSPFRRREEKRREEKRREEKRREEKRREEKRREEKRRKEKRRDEEMR